MRVLAPSPLTLIEPDACITSLLIVTAITLPIFAYRTLRERAVRSIEESLPDFLRFVASRLKVGVGLEQAVVEAASTSFKIDRTNATEEMTFDELTELIKRRARSPSVSMVLDLLKNVREIGDVPPSLLEEIAKDVDAINAIKKERARRAKGTALTSLLVSSIMLPVLFGLLMGFFTSYVNVPFEVELDTKLMVASVVVASSALSGVIAGSLLRYLAIAPAFVSLSYIIFELTSKVVVL